MARHRGGGGGGDRRAHETYRAGLGLARGPAKSALCCRAETKQKWGRLFSGLEQI